MGLIQRFGLWLAGEKASASEVVGFQVPPMLEGRPAPQLEDPTKDLKGYREWVYSCVNMNAMGVANTSLRLYAARTASTKRMLRKTRSVGKKRRDWLEQREGLQRWMRKAAEIEEVTEHPFLDLWEKGNPFLGGAQMKRLIVTFLDLVGDTYAYIAREDGIPIHLLLLPPAEMKVILNRRDLLAGYVQKHGTEEIEFEPEEIIHFMHPDPRDRYQAYGYSPLEAIGMEASLYHKMNLHEMALMDNSAVPDAFFITKHPMSVDSKNRLERKIHAKYGGVRNRGKFAVLSGEIDIKQVGLSQKEMQFVEGRKLTRNDIAVAYGVPMGIMTTEDVNKANAQVAEHHHAKYGIAPRCRIIEDEVNRTLMPLYLDDNLFVAFDNPVPEDREYELAKTTAYVTHGIYTINDVKEREGEEPVEWGERPIMPMNMLPLSESSPGGGELPPSPESEQDSASPSIKAPAPGISRPDERLEQLMRNYFEQQRQRMMLLAQYRKPDGYIRKAIGDMTAEEWDRTLAEKVEPVMVNYIEEGGTAGAQEMQRRAGIAMSFNVSNPRVQEFLSGYTIKFARQVNATTEKEIRAVLSSGLAQGLSDYEMAAQISRNVFSEERVSARAKMIARTEEARAVCAGQEEAYRMSGVVEGKRWLAGTDACQFCMTLMQEFSNVPLGQNFVPEGGLLTGTQGGTMKVSYADMPHPPAHPHCRCDIIPILVGEQIGEEMPGRWKPANTLEEARTWAESQGYTLTGVNTLPTANLINDAVAADLQYAGRLPINFKRITLRRSRQRPYMQAWRDQYITIHTPSTTAHGLERAFSPRARASAPDWALAPDELDDFRYTMMHEFGHVRRGQYREANKELTSLLESGRLQPDDFGAYVASFGSEYALESRLGEAWAETYAAAHTPGGLVNAHPLIRDLARRYLGAD